MDSLVYLIVFVSNFLVHPLESALFIVAAMGIRLTLYGHKKLGGFVN